MSDKNTNPNTNPEQQSTQNASAEPEKAQIRTMPQPFEADAETSFTNGAGLRANIDSLFRAVFADYIGCSIQMNDGTKGDVIGRTIPRDNIYVNLIFRETEGGNGWHALRRRSDTKGDDMLARVEFAFGAMASRAYVLNDVAKEALEDFVVKPQNMKSLSEDWWMSHVIETPVMPGGGMLPYGFNGGQYIDVAVIGFPIELILKKIYGGEEDGTIYDYGCKLMRFTVDGTDQVYQITKMPIKTVQKLRRINGMDRMVSHPYYMNPMVGGMMPQPFPGMMR